ncbi:MAG: radical SAM protein [Magnetococcales bacterium]|nr:radical SAM protein [Magnetococcales bacterium]
MNIKSKIVEKDRLLRVHIATSSPRSSRGIKVLSPAPFVLKSYVNWRLTTIKQSKIKIATTIFDSIDPPEKMAAKLLLEPVDVIAFSLYVWNHKETLLCAKIIKNSNPEVMIIIGGPQASPIAEELLLQNPFIDIIPYITTPGETIFYHLLSALIEGSSLLSVDGLMFRNQDDTITKTNGNVEPLDFANCPSPFLDGTIEFNDNTEYLAVLESSRGCPFDCGYCFWGSGGNTMSYYPKKRVEKEIDLIFNQQQVKHVYFADADILIKKNRAEWIVDRLLQKDGECGVSFELDARNITDSKRWVVEKLAQLPNFQFVFAIQSTNPKALATIGSTRPNPNIFKQRLTTLRSWIKDVQAVVDIMLPLPEDTYDGFRNTLNDVLTLTPTRLVLNYPVFLLPGTRFYSEREQLGLTYLDDPPHPVVETVGFPKDLVNKALILGIWCEILTYYHPAAGIFFNELTKLSPKTRPIDRMEGWIKAIEEKLPLMEFCDNLVDFAVISVENLNAAKGAILKKACEPASGHIIYSTIQQIEHKHSTPHIKAIKKGVTVFKAAEEAGISWLDESSLKTLFPKITVDGSYINIPPRFTPYKDTIAAQTEAIKTLKEYAHKR